MRVAAESSAIRANRRPRRAAASVDYSEFYKAAKFEVETDDELDNDTDDANRYGNESDDDDDDNDDDIQIIEVRSVRPRRQEIQQKTDKNRNKSRSKKNNETAKKPYSVIRFDAKAPQRTDSTTSSTIHVKREHCDEELLEEVADDAHSLTGRDAKQMKKTKTVSKPINAVKIAPQIVIAPSVSDTAIPQGDAVVGFIDETQKVRNKIFGLRDENWKSLSMNDLQINLAMKERRRKARTLTASGISSMSATLALNKSSKKRTRDTFKIHNNMNSEPRNVSSSTDSESDDGMQNQEGRRRRFKRKAATEATEKLATLSSTVVEFTSDFNTSNSATDAESDSGHSMVSDHIPDSEKEATFEANDVAPLKLSSPHQSAEKGDPKFLNGGAPSVVSNTLPLSHDLPDLYGDTYPSDEYSRVQGNNGRQDMSNSLSSGTDKMTTKIIDGEVGNTNVGRLHGADDGSEVTGNDKRLLPNNSRTDPSAVKLTHSKTRTRRPGSRKPRTRARRYLTEVDELQLLAPKLPSHKHSAPKDIEKIRENFAGSVDERQPSSLLDVARLNMNVTDGMYNEVDFDGITAPDIKDKFSDKLFRSHKQTVKVWKQPLSKEIEEYCGKLNDLNNDFTADLPAHLYAIYLLNTRNPNMPPPEISAWPLPSADLITPRQALKSTTVESLGKNAVLHMEKMKENRYSYVKFRENKHLRPGSSLMYEYWHPKINAQAEMEECLDAIYEKKINFQISCFNEKASKDTKAFIYRRSNEEDLHLDRTKKTEIMGKLDNLIDNLIDLRKKNLDNEGRFSDLLGPLDRPKENKTNYGLDWLSVASCLEQQFPEDGSRDYLNKLFSLRLQRNLSYGPTSNIPPKYHRFTALKTRRDAISKRLIASGGKPTGRKMKSKFAFLFERKPNEELRSALGTFTACINGTESDR
jgi:hypothetical protein